MGHSGEAREAELIEIGFELHGLTRYLLNFSINIY